MTIRALKVAFLGAIIAATSRIAPAQTKPAVLEIVVENLVEYVQNTYFWSPIRLGDITAVNGRPVKGAYVGVPVKLELNPAPQPGQAVANITRVSFREESFQILGLDGVPVGSILTLGTAGGPPPPGAPSAQENGDLAIVGGTGAFLGVRGEKGRGLSIAPPRAAARDEDPAKRRQIGGGHIREILYVIPLAAPQISKVAHAADFTAVSASKPALAGETLLLLANGLGPIRPGSDPGMPFPLTPAAVVNSPIQVMVNGKAAEVISAIGSPETVDRYQVNFRVPPGTEKGMATIQVTAAWIASPAATFRVQ